MISFIKKNKNLYLILFFVIFITSNGQVWRPFNDTSPWNTPIKKEAIKSSKSDEFIDYMNKRVRVVTGTSGYCTLQASVKEWSIPVYFLSDENERPKKIIIMPHNSWGGVINAPIPKTAKPTEESDKALCIVDREEGFSYGIWELTGIYPNYTSGNAHRSDLSGNGVEINGARESGFPLIAGLIRPEEIRAGEIRHALVFAFDARDGHDQFVFPATRGADFDSTDSKSAPPMGTRFKLREDFDLSRYPEGAKIVLKALKKYGMYLGDENDSRSMSLYFQSNSDWNGLFDEKDRKALRKVLIQDFIVVE